MSIALYVFSVKNCVIYLADPGYSSLINAVDPRYLDFVISNNRLSRRENLINFSHFPQYFQHIFLIKGVNLHVHL